MAHKSAPSQSTAEAAAIGISQVATVVTFLTAKERLRISSISSYAKWMVIIFAPSGVHRSQEACSDQFLQLAGIHFDGAGHLLVANCGNSRVQVHSYGDGAHVRTLGGNCSGHIHGQFSRPCRGIAIDSDVHNQYRRD